IECLLHGRNDPRGAWQHDELEKEANHGLLPPLPFQANSAQMNPSSVSATVCELKVCVFINGVTNYSAIPVYDTTTNPNRPKTLNRCSLFGGKIMCESAN
ncbi:MAG: hypothetical protein AAB263_07170, partial [Planctomycetota bacterium]